MFCWFKKLSLCLSRIFDGMVDLRKIIKKIICIKIFLVEKLEEVFCCWSIMNEGKNS